MKLKTRLCAGLGVLICATNAFSDVITLKTGESIRCTFLGGTSRSIRVEANGVVKTYDVAQIATVSFIDGDVSGPAVAAAKPAVAPAVKSVLPASTSITIRVIDPVDSGSARPGQTFSAAVDEPVTVNGTELIPKDAAVLMRIVSESISVNGSSLTVALSTIAIGGKQVPISSSDVKQLAPSTGTTQEAARVGSSTSALAGVAGVLGAGRTVSTVGSAAGTTINASTQLIVHGPKVKIPAGTRLVFRTQSQVTF
jgi:hypothetical protein